MSYRVSMNQKMSTSNNVNTCQSEDSDYISDIEIVRSLLYCFQGIDSQFIVFNQNENQFVVLAKLNFYQVSKVKRLIELGYLHNIVQKYTENNINNKNGIVASGIGFCIYEELCVYYETINKLQKEVNNAFENSKQYSLGNLLCWSILWITKLQDLCYVVKVIDEKRGGELISVISSFEYCANPFLKNLAIRIIKVATKPLIMMLCNWMIDGDLIDPFEEFFICQNSDINNIEMLWNNRYSLRKSMIPSFFNIDDVNRILRTGKYIYFLHTVCKCESELTPSRKTLIALRNSQDKDLFPTLNQGFIKEIINNACNESSIAVLNILKEKFKLFLHFEGIRRYMLLGQGDFVTNFLEILQPHLDKSSNILGPHMFRNFLDTAIRTSNAQYDDSIILKTLDVKLLLTSGEDCGWDIMQLEYSTNGPLETIFEFCSSGKYSIMFVFLWRMKRIDFVLSQMWRELNLLIKTSYHILPDIRYALKSTNNLVAEMVHSMRQIQFYVLSDVIETEWEHFRKTIDKALMLETVIEAHNKFLKNIFKRSMQTEETHDLSKKMRQLFESILELRGIQERFHSQSQCELSRRKDLEKYIEVHGTCYDVEQNALQIKEDFALEVDQYENIVKEISHSYKVDLGKFLKKLIKVSNDDQDAIQSLANRINFNEFYSKHDQELQKCATYVCRSHK